MGVCVPNFRSVSFFVWPGNVTQINTQIHIYILVKLGISLTGCSPYVDFEIRKYFISRKSSKTVRIFHLKFCRYRKILIPRFSILAPYICYQLQCIGFSKKHSEFFISQNPREASSRSRIFLFSLVYIYVCICVFMFVRPPGQTKNDRDLKFGTHTPLDHI